MFLIIPSSSDESDDESPELPELPSLLSSRISMNKRESIIGHHTEDPCRTNRAHYIKYDVSLTYTLIKVLYIYNIPFLICL